MRRERESRREAVLKTIDPETVSNTFTSTQEGGRRMIPATIRPRQNFLNGLIVFGSGRDALLGLPRRPLAISTPPEEVSILVFQNSGNRIKEVTKASEARINLGVVYGVRIYVYGVGMCQKLRRIDRRHSDCEVLARTQNQRCLSGSLKPDASFLGK